MHCIQTGAKEPIEAMALDILGERLSGLSNLFLQVRRLSDNYYLDWTNNTFTLSPALALAGLQEVDSLESPGEYALHLPGMGHSRGFNTAVLTNALSEDTYRFLLLQEGAPQNAVNMPQLNHLHVGGYVNLIDEAVSAQASPADVVQIVRDYGLDHLVTVNPGIVPPAANTYIRQILDKEDALLARQQVYSVQQNWAFRSADQVLMGQVWIEASNLIVLGASGCIINWCRHPDGAVIFTETIATPDARGVFTLTRTVPNLIANTAYYAEASLTVPDYGSIKGIKGVFTIG